VDSRTRVKNAIKRRPIDRIPRYDAFWEDTLTAWGSDGYPRGTNPEDVFNWDIVMMSLDLSMRQKQELLFQDGEYMTVRDRFGYTVRKAIGKSRTIEFSNHATKDRQAWKCLKPKFRLDPNEPARLDDKSCFLHMDEYPTWSEVKHKYDCLRKTRKYIAFEAYGPWEGTWRHRGYSELMMDLALDPDWVSEMGGTLVNLLMACLGHCIELDITPDALFLADDVACNKGLLFSPKTWRKVFKPSYIRLGDFLKRHEISFWLHCCGNCEALLDDLIECGVQVIQPLQVQAGMDVRKLKPTYGEKLTFWGNIDAHAMSGPADVLEAEVRDKITAAKQGGGYIYHSDHSVPPEVSYERYKWIMKLVEKYGRYE